MSCEEGVPELLLGLGAIEAGYGGCFRWDDYEGAYLETSKGFEEEGEVSLWISAESAFINMDHVITVAIRQWADSSEKKIVYYFDSGTEWSEPYSDERWDYLRGRLL
jgi:hypothetical protein